MKNAGSHQDARPQPECFPWALRAEERRPPPENHRFCRSQGVCRISCADAVRHQLRPDYYHGTDYRSPDNGDQYYIVDVSQKYALVLLNQDVSEQTIVPSFLLS